MVSLALHEGVAVSMEIPQKVTLEIVETEPAMKGQTASGSFKPAMLSNGVRTMVPTHIVVGTRVVVNDRRRLLRRARQGLTRHVPPRRTANRDPSAAADCRSAAASAGPLYGPPRCR